MDARIVRVAVCFLLPVTAALLLSGCGGGSGDIKNGAPSPSGGCSSSSPSSNGSTAPSPLAGIWTGVDSVSGSEVTGLIDASGNFDFIRTGTSSVPGDNAQFSGAATVSGSSFCGNMQGFENLGSGYAFNTSNATHGTGVVSGTVQAESSIDASYTFTPDGGTLVNGQLNPLTYTSPYTGSSSLSVIAGTYTYTDPTSGEVTTLAISSGSGTDSVEGTVYAPASDSSCEVTGSVSFTTGSYDVYSIMLTYSSCTTGPYSVLQNVTLSGLAMLNNTSSSNSPTLLAGLSGQASGGTYYGVVYSLQAE